MRAPRARRSTSSGLAIANVLGTGIQLNCDCLDPAHGLVAVDAARIVSGYRLVVVEIRWVAAAVAAGCAAHADIAPHRLGCHRSLKYGLGVQVGFKFKLETGEKVKEESGAESRDWPLKAGISSPD